MTSADTVAWLLKEMHGACKLGLPMVGCTGWPNPAALDPPGLRRGLSETDLQRALGFGAAPRHYQRVDQRSLERGQSLVPRWG
jgi:hypothetical protein